MKTMKTKNHLKIKRQMSKNKEIKTSRLIIKQQETPKNKKKMTMKNLKKVRLKNLETLEKILKHISLRLDKRLLKEEQMDLILLIMKILIQKKMNHVRERLLLPEINRVRH